MVAAHISNIDQMTPNRLSLFAMIYTSDEMLSAENIDQAKLDMLGDTLLKKCAEFDPEEYGMVCTVAHHFPEFLYKTMAHAQEILSQDDITTDTLTTIVESYAYSAEILKEIAAKDNDKVLTPDFFESLEMAVMHHAPRLNPHEAL